MAKYCFLFIIISYLVVKIFLFAYFQPVAIVIPHHNLVQSTRQKFLSDISHQRLITKHIVLISPDHFGIDQHQLTTSSRTWALSTGKATYSNFLHLDLPKNDFLLQDDHGIYNPLSDLKKYFPQADFLPILIGQQTNREQLEPLLDSLNNYCHFDCLLVASVDFSHYLPSTLAEVHDAATLNNLQNLDRQNILDTEVDSPQSLYLMISHSLFKNAKKWTLFAHTNSGIIAQDPDHETTTHVFGYYSRGSFQKSAILTSVNIPYSLNRLQNQTTLGDRFFYGPIPQIGNTGVFVVGTISTKSTTIKSYLPLKNNLFIRGAEKQNLIKKYFDSLPKETNLTKDYFWGKLIYAN